MSKKKSDDNVALSCPFISASAVSAIGRPQVVPTVSRANLGTRSMTISCEGLVACVGCPDVGVDTIYIMDATVDPFGEPVARIEMVSLNDDSHQSSNKLGGYVKTTLHPKGCPVASLSWGTPYAMNEGDPPLVPLGVVMTDGSFGTLYTIRKNQKIEVEDEIIWCPFNNYVTSVAWRPAPISDKLLIAISGRSDDNKGSTEIAIVRLPSETTKRLHLISERAPWAAINHRDMLPVSVQWIRQEPHWERIVIMSSKGQVLVCECDPAAKLFAEKIRISPSILMPVTTPTFSTYISKSSTMVVFTVEGINLICSEIKQDWSFVEKRRVIKTRHKTPISSITSTCGWIVSSSFDGDIIITPHKKPLKSLMLTESTDPNATGCLLINTMPFTPFGIEFMPGSLTLLVLKLLCSKHSIVVKTPIVQQIEPLFPFAAMSPQDQMSLSLESPSQGIYSSNRHRIMSGSGFTALASSVGCSLHLRSPALWYYSINHLFDAYRAARSSPDGGILAIRMVSCIMQLLPPFCFLDLPRDYVATPDYALSATSPAATLSATRTEILRVLSRMSLLNLYKIRKSNPEAQFTTQELRSALTMGTFLTSVACRIVKIWTPTLSTESRYERESESESSTSDDDGEKEDDKKKRPIGRAKKTVKRRYNIDLAKLYEPDITFQPSVTASKVAESFTWVLRDLQLAEFVISMAGKSEAKVCIILNRW
eukprot:TRINITY_DN7672_c0_g1_i3.p1 TRINITY_DN7672_c0_g1~~TRINITY_DN7672_c0_g1_i3.p1  ORF type:complete len:708 (+),score=111.71 TRINITY_DN7672_c0_g1_i3:40-2163(+)